MGQWVSGADVWDFGTELTTGATTTARSYLGVRGGENFNFAWKMESAGAADVTITFKYWVHPVGKSVTSANAHDMTPGATVGSDTNDFSVVIKANETTVGTWQRYNPPSELAYPFCAYTISVTENGGADVTSGILVVCRNMA